MLDAMADADGCKKLAGSGGKQQSISPSPSSTSEQPQAIADGDTIYYTYGYSRGETTEGEMFA